MQIASVSYKTVDPIDRVVLTMTGEEARQLKRLMHFDNTIPAALSRNESVKAKELMQSVNLALSEIGVCDKALED